MENTNPTQDTPDADADPMSVDIDTLTAQLAECEAKLAQMHDTVLRERADLENHRKRLQRDVEQARRFANEKLLAELLHVIDNLERGLSVETSDAQALRDGIALTLRELIRVTETSGLKSVDPAGHAFDPELHQAMSLVDSPEHAPGSVVSVLQKGYTLNDRLLRPALVSVAKTPD